MANLHVRRLGYALGAAITGVDATERLDRETVAAIRQAWLEHVVLCFPGQDLSPEQFKDFCAQFGDLDQDNSGSLNRIPDQPGITMLTNKPVTINGQRAGGNAPSRWHSDNSYRSRPPTFTFLLAQELPDVGGNTMFANMYVAYETLSPAFQRAIDPLQAVQDIALWPTYRGKNTPAVQAILEANPPTARPLVQLHPETGRKALYIGQDRVRNFAGMTEEETTPIMDFLNRHATRYEFIYRHCWSVNDLVMWDNRCSLHYPVPDYDHTQVRRMLRCNVYSDSLVAATSEVGAKS
jgi:taurine dioxygenase